MAAAKTDNVLCSRNRVLMFAGAMEIRVGHAITGAAIEGGVRNAILKIARPAPVAVATKIRKNAPTMSRIKLAASVAGRAESATRFRNAMKMANVKIEKTSAGVASELRESAAAVTDGTLVKMTPIIVVRWETMGTIKTVRIVRPTIQLEGIARTMSVSKPIRMPVKIAWVFRLPINVVTHRNQSANAFR